MNQPIYNNTLTPGMSAIRYDIIDLFTKTTVGTAKTRARATQSADRRNQQYGAHRFHVRAIYSEGV